MSNDPSLVVDASALNKVSEILRDYPANAERVVARVLWRTRDFTKHEIIRQVPKIYRITQSEMKSSLGNKRFVVLKQTGNQQVSFDVVGKRLTLSRFHHSPKKPVYGKKAKRVVSRVEVFHGTGMKNIRKSVGEDGKLKSVFLAPTGAKSASKEDGTPKVPYIFFHRTGRPSKKNPKKEEIVPRISIAIPQMINNPKVAKPLREKIGEKLEKEVTQQLKFEASKMAKRLIRQGARV